MFSGTFCELHVYNLHVSLIVNFHRISVKEKNRFMDKPSLCMITYIVLPPCLYDRCTVYKYSYSSGYAQTFVVDLDGTGFVLENKTNLHTQLSLCMKALTVSYHTREGEAFFVREPQSKNSCYHTRGGPSHTKGAWDILHKEGYPKQRDIYHILHILSYTLGELSYKWIQRRSILYDDGHHKIRRDHHS